jgi:DNA-binding transcriptional ArsR family regulator
VRPAAPSLLPILRSEAQGRLLARLATNPDREWTVRGLARELDLTHVTVGRELDRAEQAGVVTSRREGRNRMVRFDPTHPLARPLRELLLATFGAPHVIAEEFGSIAGLDLVLIFGSWAVRYHGEPGEPPGDIDVLVIGDDVDPDAVGDAALRAEQRLRVEVQPTLRRRQAWQAGDDPFLADVRERPVVAVLGDPDVAVSH